MTNSLDKFTETFAKTLIAAIEKGVAPWQQPWTAGKRPFPRNAVTNRTYRGSNLVMLFTKGCLAGYQDHRWAGFHQIRKAGGAVRKGETGTPVLIWKEYKPDSTETTAVASTADEKRIFCRIKYVFNVDQADGLSLPALAAAPAPADWETSRAVQQMVEDAHVKPDPRTGPGLLQPGKRHDRDAAPRAFQGEERLRTHAHPRTRSRIRTPGPAEPAR